MPTPYPANTVLLKTGGWSGLRDRRSDLALERAARARGLVVRALSPLYRTARARPALMLGFTGYPRAALVTAAGRLADLLCER